MGLLSFLYKRKNAFKYALSGIKYTILTQKNTWVHAAASILVVIIGIWLDISSIKWAVLILTMGIVWTAEFINTAIETVVDLTCPENNPLAKISKDASAAAVLIAALSAVLIGFLVLGPSLWLKLKEYLEIFF